MALLAAPEARGIEIPAGEVQLIKCCLLEEHIETDGQTVVVPWGRQPTNTWFGA